MGTSVKSDVTGTMRSAALARPGGRCACLLPRATETTSEIIATTRAQQRRDGNQHGVGRVGINAGAVGAHRPFLADLEIEQELIGVVLPAEGAERRPFQAFLRGRPEIAVVRGDRSR
jgi:hypothetical protein